MGVTVVVCIGVLGVRMADVGVVDVDVVDVGVVGIGRGVVGFGVVGFGVVDFGVVGVSVAGKLTFTNVQPSSEPSLQCLNPSHRVSAGQQFVSGQSQCQKPG